jgi:hypothetical protein
MPSKPKLIGAAVAMTAATAVAAVIAAQAYGLGDSSPPTVATAAEAAPAGEAAPAADAVPAAEPGDAAWLAEAGGPAASQLATNTPPMDEAMNHMMAAPSTAETNRVSRNSGKAVFLIAQLNGRNEVPAADGSKVGDRDGRAIQIVRIRGNQVSFATAWNGIAAPTASHIHEGVAGVNGAVKVPFFGTTLPGGVSAVTGSITVDDSALLRNLAKNPNKFYANLHTAEFPGGAVRAQFQRLNRPVDLERVLTFGKLFAVGSGKQEVPVAGGSAVGDRDGRSIGFVWAKGGRVDFSLRWSRIAPPTLGHIHQGKAGVNGAVVVDLFSAKDGLPATINGVAGTAKGLDRKLTNDIARNPRGFYTNLHTAEFPGGAVRGQLSRVG